VSSGVVRRLFDQELKNADRVVELARLLERNAELVQHRRAVLAGPHRPQQELAGGVGVPSDEEAAGAVECQLSGARQGAGSTLELGATPAARGCRSVVE